MRHTWAASGRVVENDDGSCTWTGSLGENNVQDPCNSGGFLIGGTESVCTTEQ